MIGGSGHLTPEQKGIGKNGKAAMFVPVAGFSVPTAPSPVVGYQGQHRFGQE
jgi:hypothetical protein